MQRCLPLLLLFIAFTSLAHAGTSILESDGRTFTGPWPPPPYAKLLADNGFELGFPRMEMRTLQPLTLDMMMRYNLVVVPSIARSNMKPAELTALLDNYLKAGGGVFVFQEATTAGLAEYDAMNGWLKQYGAAMRWEEMVDAEHEYKNPPIVPYQSASFLWTENIARSPLTKDVRTLFYRPGYFSGPFVMGLAVDKQWQVLVSTAATTKSYPLTSNKADFTPARMKDVAPSVGAVPLLAVCQVGKGRLAVFGGAPSSYWYDLKKPVFAGVPQERGDGQRASDWQPLFFNVLRWLGERGSKTGKPGGYTGQAAFKVMPDWGNRTPIDWEKVDAEGVSPDLVQQAVAWHSDLSPESWKDWEAGKYRPYKLLIAARTKLSGGKGSVADWKAAAQAAGYSAVVFREKILELTREQWDGFLKECAAASDADFRAIPGQEFDDWVGNRFMRFTGDLKYPPHMDRLTNGKMRDQLNWFCDVGWPVNFPMTIKDNTTEFWNYRLSEAMPVYIYRDGKLAEDNRRPWEELVDSYEYPTPVALHVLDDPAQVPQAARGASTYALATSLPTFNGRSAGGFFTIANNPKVFVSTGPIIDRFQAVNFYRTTLGSREIAGSYRYRVFIKAHADKPIARVELWGGDEPLRTYRPNTKEFSIAVDELHDRQRGLWLKVVDAEGGEAVMTGIMVHDKMSCFVWCGDLENSLPYGLGVTPEGGVFQYGIATRVKSSFQGIDGPAASGYDFWSYVPAYMDTSSPAIGTLGQARLINADGKQLPDAGEWYTSRVNMPYGNRDIMIERLTATRAVNWQEYVPKHQPTVNGWYPYTKNHDVAAFDLVHEDADLHRDANEPGLQWNTGTFTFKQPVTLSSTAALNVVLAVFNSNVAKDTTTAYTHAGELPVGHSVIKLGKGGYLTWGAQMGNVTVFGLDEHLTVEVRYDGTHVYPNFGYNLAGRQFAPGDKLTYGMLIMRWPTGVPFTAGLDARVAEALNLAGGAPRYTVTPQRGTVAGTQLFLDLQARDGVFAGRISRAFLPLRLPARISGLNPRWTAAVWRKGIKGQILVPLTPRPGGGPAYFSLDLAKESGDLFVGSVATCDQPTLWLRALQRSDGGVDILAHNPGETLVTTKITGSPGGPLEGWSQAVQLTPGEEKRLRGR
ncbi:MAG: hypothetical protein ACYC7E_15280 [Armatimonadota bacterium]